MKNWIEAQTRLPTNNEAGGFGAVEVILQCNHVTASGDVEQWQRMRIARPIFVGGCSDRVLWVTAEDKSNTPIENASWLVSHWRPFPKFPKPLPDQSQ